jgi:hypothetical protein
VKFNRKHKSFASAAILLLLGAGCGGISASHSISPASFLLPGLLKAEPKQPSTAPTSQPEQVQQLAQAQ